MKGVDSLKVLLLKDVPKLGKKGEVKDVSDGYARNYLIPKGLAKELKEGDLKSIEVQRERERKRQEKIRRESEEKLERLRRGVLKIPVKSGEKGRLYGSVTSSLIARFISEKLGMEVDKKNISLEKQIKEIGIYDVEIKFPGGVKGKIKIEIIPEG